jgi:hypothetical protein
VDLSVGPRQTIPLEGSFARGDRSDQRIFDWSATADRSRLQHAAARQSRAGADCDET